jgi:Heat shock factor binding protein 1
MGKMSDMNSRMDELEQSIAELMNQAGLEAERKPTSSTKSGRSLNLDNSII